MLFKSKDVVVFDRIGLDAEDPPRVRDDCVSLQARWQASFFHV